MASIKFVECAFANKQKFASIETEQEAVQTCVLSKSWRYVWSARPAIDFLEDFFNGNTETFLSVLNKTLQFYHDQKLCIQEFRVKMLKSDSESISLLEKWIPFFAMNKGLKTFDLYFDGSRRPAYFDLPSVVFEVESLQKLSLDRCNLNQNPIDKVLFKHLQTLCLQRVYITEENFETILSSCPLIENLSLCGCEGLRTIKVHKLRNLNYFLFNRIYHEVYEKHLISVEIDAPTIKTIRIMNCENWLHHHIHFPHLSVLFLNRVRLSSKSFEFFSCNLPSLEKLTLVNCYGFEEFHLLSRSIKHLSIFRISNPIKATIDAPNILVFNYEGNISTSICFRTTSSKWKSNIFLRNYADFEYHASSWFHKLSELLKSLSQSVISLKLIQECRIFRQIEDPPDINIYGGFDKALVIEHLSLRGHYSSSSFKAFLNCLFRVCRPRNISQCWYLDAHNDWQRKEEKLIEFLVEILLIERDMRQHFWQQDLEEVSMDENGHEWHPGEGIKFRFRLKWKELS
ncbi:hypothetical protein DH2020_027659 [Rehmannia glutinosa]|uniref:F-box/LRR-repeat protein 15/At3g58940/PEG3-like LRR domain-containing protein n=1 Tax=Rehmannia glutinosa TaxID=99300 RepID=A0ABR0VTL4_REHGL